MTTAYQPEIGQMCFGNPWNGYAVPEFVEAMVVSLNHESNRIHRNNTQRFGDHLGEGVNVKMGEVDWHTYWWGDDEAPEASLPNLAFQDVEIRWYKHIGRGMSTNVEKTEAEWVTWFNAAMASIRTEDKRD